MKNKDKVQVPQRNEMLNVNYNVLYLVLLVKNEEYNPEENIPNGKYLRNVILQKIVKQ